MSSTFGTTGDPKCNYSVTQFDNSKDIEVTFHFFDINDRKEIIEILRQKIYEMEKHFNYIP